MCEARSRAGPGAAVAVDSADRGGTPGGDVCSLRGVDFQKFIETQLVKLMSLSAVYELLHELGYKWLVPRPRHRKLDPDAIAAFQKKSR